MLHIVTQYNFANILTNYWGYQGTYYKLIQPVFHHEGNTAALFLDDTLEVDTSIEEDNGKMILSILGSNRTMSELQKATLVCG